MKRRTMPNLASLPDLKAYMEREIAAGVRWAFDTCYCPNCGERSKERGEVRQAERDEVCVYVCDACGAVADESPF